MRNAPENSTLSREPELDRRKFLTHMMTVAAATKMSAALAQESPDTEEKKQDEPRLQEVFPEPLHLSFDEEAMKTHPYAKFEVLTEPDRTSPNCRVFLQSDGSMKMETVPHLFMEGRVKAAREARQAEKQIPIGKSIRRERRKAKTRPDIDPGSGTCFFIDDGTQLVLFSNQHVLNGAEHRFEAIMDTDLEGDIATVSGHFVQRCPGDKFPIPVTEIDDKVSNKDLPNREVQISGYGEDMYRIAGKPINTTAKFTKDGKTKEETQFALKVSSKDMRSWNQIPGMSGSAVCLTDTNACVGMLRAVSEHKISDDEMYYLLHFTGVDELKVIREVSKKRWETKEALQRREELWNAIFKLQK